MQRVAATLVRDQNLQSIEDEIATVKEIFRLQGAAELQEAEDRYLPRPRDDARAIVLAATRGSALGELTADRPKAMVAIRGQPLLGHIVAAYNAAGIKHISVVRGYCAAAIDLPGLRYVDNEDYAQTGELASLARALESDPETAGELYVCFGDVIFKRYVLDNLAEPDDDLVICVDTDWRESVNRNRAADYVQCTEPHSRRDFYREIYLRSAGEDLPVADRHGEWMGILRARGPALAMIRRVVLEMIALPQNRTAKLHNLLSELVRRGERVRVIYTTGHWLDVDSLADVLAANRFA
jgi:phosphoenolpyruvate phosphomutase